MPSTTPPSPTPPPTFFNYVSSTVNQRRLRLPPLQLNFASVVFEEPKLNFTSVTSAINSKLLESVSPKSMVIEVVVIIDGLIAC
ncbi:hypothetical protein F2Q69_00035236 [Brassica cretica]|uniref:Uncharacterized protein n=1 Tax=Brassica cretica TaxID=69181 RepID=A0A8S9ST67_BRACR|nr:hypothetical protein F2Q69_00035236 [Brassica cretica]